MKYITATLCVLAALAAPAVLAAEPSVISPTEAMQAIKAMDLPAGLTLTDAIEPLKEPVVNKEGQGKHEQWFGGGWGGIGRWGGVGGCGPYRFGFGLGGLTGWAYPLNYWNTWGAGLYGGGCGFGFPYGNFYYC
jgi:hypothetical protein